MLEKMEAVRAKVAQCIAKAESLYGIKMPQVDVRFDMRGRSSGAAGWKPTFNGRTYYIRFNVNFMSVGGKTWEHLFTNTVPHEVAHSVCQAFPNLGVNHDSGWKKVCLALGGNGKTRFDSEDAPEAHAMVRPYVYTGSTGKTVCVSTRIHNKIQRGAAYRYREAGVINCNSPVMKNVVKGLKMTALKIETPKEATKTVKVTTAKTVKAKAPAKVKTVSAADQMRAFIATGASADDCVKFGIEKLGQTATRAKSYVKWLRK